MTIMEMLKELEACHDIIIKRPKKSIIEQLILKRDVHMYKYDEEGYEKPRNFKNYELLTKLERTCYEQAHMHVEAPEGYWVDCLEGFTISFIWASERDLYY